MKRQREDSLSKAKETEGVSSDKKTLDDSMVALDSAHSKHHRHESQEILRPRKSSEQLQDAGQSKKTEVSDTPTKKKKSQQSPPTHAIAARDFERGQWVRKSTQEDLSRLPSVYHILFVILDNAQEEQLQATLQKYPVQSTKLIKRLGAFLVCDSEKKAEELFHVLNKEFWVFPLKEVPRQVKVDQLRSEICFMEGVRPPKSTVAAERFMYKHLGFKDGN